MANRFPAERDLALSLWARLSLIEQVSLAILDRSFPQAAEARGTRRRNALLAAEANPSLAAMPAQQRVLSPQTWTKAFTAHALQSDERAGDQSALVSKGPRE
jgi:hypothetical protein